MRKPYGGSLPEALLLTPEAPYPIVGGGAMRTASVLEYLAARYTLDIIVFREPGAVDPRVHLSAHLFRDVHVIDLPFHAKDTWSRLVRNAKRFVRGAPPLIDRFDRFDDAIKAAVGSRRYDVGVIEHFWCARYVELLREFCTTVVLDLHNVESVLLMRCASTEHWAGAAAFHRFAVACRKLEQRLLSEFSTILVPSDTDKAHVLQLAPLTPTVVYPNTIPFLPRPRALKANEIVFTGNLGYHPNIHAIRWFHEKVWPELRSRWPGLVWKIVGRNHTLLRDQIAGDRIHFTGPVPDALQEMASARMSVVPLFAGSGTRIKIIEAWAAGLPVVSTSVGAEGLPCVEGEHILIEDDPSDFVRAASSIMEEDRLGDALGAKGRTLYEKELTWQSAWKQLENSGL